MKFMNILKLLSVLLCIFMLFVACDDKGADGEVNTQTGVGSETPSEGETAEPTEAPTDEPLLESVEAKFDNFFEILAAETGELTDAERLEGVVENTVGDLVLFKSAEVDTKNIVTETFKVFNKQSGEIVLTEKNSYFNGNYDPFDFNDLMVYASATIVKDELVVESDKTYPENVMSVRLVDDGDAKYIVVLKAVVTEIEEAVREENRGGCVYEIATAYSYYDAYGNLITESNRAVDIYYESGYDNVYTMYFGATVAYFDAETDELVKTSNDDYEHISGAFEYENGRYGYYGMQSAGTGYFIDILDKNSGETFRYHLSNSYGYPSGLFYLHNGDLLIQYMAEREEGEPHNCRYLTMTYNLTQVILSLDDGKETVIENPSYFINTMVTGEDFAEDASIGEDYNVAITDNARNIALVYKIKNKTIEMHDDIVVFDNDMSVLYELERVIPEHDFGGSYVLGYEMLTNGHKIVYLVDDATADRAIVKEDGTVRCYLKDDSLVVVGDHIVDTDGEYVFDYDLKVVYNYEENEYKYGGELFGKPAFYKVDDEYARTYYSFEILDGKVEMKALFDGKVASSVTFAEDYAVVYHINTGRYVLYNESMKVILKTKNAMTVWEFDGGYIVQTIIDGKGVLYTLK